MLHVGILNPLLSVLYLLKIRRIGEVCPLNWFMNVGWFFFRFVYIFHEFHFYAKKFCWEQLWVDCWSLFPINKVLR